MKRRVLVEICVEGIAGARSAIAGGADRVELCADGSLAREGLTPDLTGLAALIGPGPAGASCPIHVLIRPRAGGFVYDDAEFEAMAEAVDDARRDGAAGVVIGVMRADGSIDVERTAELVARARPLSVTFHKAFDTARDPLAALDHLMDLGVDRVLTSGQAPTALAGLTTLAALVARGRDRIRILAGGRVRAEDVASLLAAGIRELHTASAVRVHGHTDARAVARFMHQVREAEQDLG